MISKVTNITKQYFFLLALVAMFVGFSAFKYNKTHLQPESGWYQVSILDPNDFDNPTKQIIGSRIGDNEPEGSCDIEHDETPPCAIHLDLSSFEEESITGLRVSLATDTLDAKIDDSVSDDGYAREEPE